MERAWGDKSFISGRSFGVSFRYFITCHPQSHLTQVFSMGKGDTLTTKAAKVVFNYKDYSMCLGFGPSSPAQLSVKNCLAHAEEQSNK